MTIRLNGDAHEVADDATVAALLESLDIRGRRVAVELNRDILPKERYDGTRLSPGDVIEVVQFVGGG